MVAYKDILEAFGGNTSYADRFQSAALKGDTEGMSNIRNEYNVSIGKNKETPKTKTDTDNNNNNYTPVPTQTYTPEGYTPQQQNQNQNLGNWNYGSDTAERQEEIVRNLNEAYAQDPSRFSDWATFANNFNYDYGGRSDKERETMRNWYESQVGQTQQMDYNNPNNTDYFFNQLLNGGTLGGEGAAATQAMNRYKDYQSLSSMTPEQIASAISSNSINPVGQSMIDLKNYSPALYAQVQSILQNQTLVDDINSLGSSIYDGLTKTESNSNYTKYNFTDEYAKNASVIKQYNESLYKKIEGLGGDTAAYVEIVASMLQNPLIQANKDEIENIEGEINKIQEQIYNIGDTVRAKLGSEAPEDLVSAYISNQTKQLQNQLRTLQNSLLVSQGKLDNQLSDVETMIDAINQGIKTYGEGTGDDDYQFVSATKYQQAGYFNKKTGEFIPLNGSSSSSGGSGGGGGVGRTYVDTNDYQDDSTERLKEIQSNLEKALKKTPQYFKDRSTFNDYFKYGQRSSKQKAVLDAFWINNKGAISRIGVTGGTAEDESGISNDFVKAVKKDLLSGRIISFAASDMKKQYPQYWKIGWESTNASASLMNKIGYISTLDEIEKISGGIGDTLVDNLYKGYWSNPNSITKAANEIKKIGDGNTEKERNKIIIYLNGLGVSQSNVEKILKQTGIKEKYIDMILATALK